MRQAIEQYKMILLFALLLCCFGNLHLNVIAAPNSGTHLIRDGADKPHLKPHGRGHHHIQPPHHREFAGEHPSKRMAPPLLILLAEKYSVATLSDWQQTVARHEQLRTAIQRLTKLTPALRRSIASMHTEDYLAKMEQDQWLRQSLQSAVKKRDAVAIRTNLQTVLSKMKQRNVLLERKLSALRTERAQMQ